MTQVILQTTRIRLRIPEAYPIHTSIIEWNSRYSLDRIPDAALGPGRVNLKMMRAVLSSWERVHFFKSLYWRSVVYLAIIGLLGCGPAPTTRALRLPLEK